MIASCQLTNIFSHSEATFGILTSLPPTIFRTCQCLDCFLFLCFVSLCLHANLRKVNRLPPCTPRKTPQQPRWLRHRSKRSGSLTSRTLRSFPATRAIKGHRDIPSSTRVLATDCVSTAIARNSEVRPSVKAVISNSFFFSLPVGRKQLCLRRKPDFS